jgi:hypothetical protein
VVNEPVSVDFRAGDLLIHMEVWVAGGPRINDCPSCEDGVLVDVLSNRIVVPVTCLEDALHPHCEIVALVCNLLEALLHECFVNEAMHGLFSMVSQEPVCEQVQEIILIVD